LGFLCADAAEVTGFEPFACDSLQLAEQVDLWFLAGVAEFREQQVTSQPKQDRRAADLVERFDGQVYRLADDALVADLGGAD